MGTNRDYRKRQQKAAEQEAKRHAPTSPDDPNAKNLEVWQPERLTPCHLPQRGRPWALPRQCGKTPLPGTGRG